MKASFTNLQLSNPQGGVTLVLTVTAVAETSVEAAALGAVTGILTWSPSANQIAAIQAAFAALGLNLGAN